MISIRTCVGCGARGPQAELVRFSARGGELALDEGRRAPGRGAYLHRNPSCWQSFTGRRGVVRSLRATPSRAARLALRDALEGAARTPTTGRED